MLEIIQGLTEMMIDNELHSKVSGNRNWIIKVENADSGNRYITYAGRPGNASYFMQRGFITDIVKYKIRWYYFTYKKDFDEAIEKLTSIGIKHYRY